ncbi:reverse transcriptase, partial [Phytophthora megakarya]
MVHLAAVAAEVTSVQTARLFGDMVFKHHGMPTDFVSDRGTDTEKIHAQAGPDATTSGESVQGTDADKTNELDPRFSSQAMDFVHERQAVVRFVQDAIAASADGQKLNADNNGRGGLSDIGHAGLLQEQQLSPLSELSSLNRRKSLHAGVEHQRTVVNPGLTM